MRIGLIDLPFSPLDRPNLGLELLAATINRASGRHRASVLYLKYEYAAAIGYRRYNALAAAEFCDPLLGDLAFAFDAIPEAGVYGRASSNGSLGVEDQPRQAILEAARGSLSASDVSSILAASRRFVSQTVTRILEHRFDAVGFNLMFCVRPALMVSAATKLSAPHVKVLFGGVHCDGEMGAALFGAYSVIDVVVRGEGEPVINQLLDAIEDRDSAPIAGVLRRTRIHLLPAAGERTPVVRKMDQLPLPDYRDWLAVFRDASVALSPVLSYETSRGCWFGERMHCVFCGLNGATMQYRSKSPDHVISELMALRDLGIARVDTTDLILNHDYFRDLLPLLSAEATGLRLFYETRPTLTRRQVDGLAAAGVWAIQAGIESLSTPHLQLMRKGSCGHHGVRILKWSFARDIRVVWNVLVGLPGEEAKWFEQMAAVVRAIVHLEPPALGCVPILMTRFSPIFDEHTSRGYVERLPSHHYKIAFPELNARQIEGIALYFEGIPRVSAAPDTLVAIATLREAVRQWIEAQGSRYCFLFRSAESLWVVDGRGLDGEHELVHELDTQEAAILLMCDAGLRRGQMEKRLGGSLGLETIERVLSDLLKHRLLIDVDGVLLATPVDLTTILHDVTATPDIAVAMGKRIYLERAAAQRRGRLSVAGGEP